LFCGRQADHAAAELLWERDGSNFSGSGMALTPTEFGSLMRQVCVVAGAVGRPVFEPSKGSCTAGADRPRTGSGTADPLPRRLRASER
jgi:hypothetical protein